jgi:hypothetical protein
LRGFAAAKVANFAATNSHAIQRPSKLGGVMFRFCVVCCLWLLGSLDTAMAESAAQRGDYLVNTIMACGNCHSPRDASGQLIKEKAFSGG